MLWILRHQILIIIVVVQEKPLIIIQLFYLSLINLGT